MFNYMFLLLCYQSNVVAMKSSNHIDCVTAQKYVQS